MAERRMHFVIPTYEPVGGIVKIFDYVTHARALGYHVQVWSRAEYSPDLPLLQNKQFRHLVDDPEVTFHSNSRLRFGDRDLVMLSLPREYNFAYRHITEGRSPERVIHIIQNVRHVNPEWLSGEGTRVLTRAASRISINDVVAKTIEPWLDPRGLHRVINLGHVTEPFQLARDGGIGDEGRPVRVAYTTWKSHVGDSVQNALRDDPGFEFRAIRETVTWDDLRELYQWSDVFLCTPRSEEGMYLPGLEAMAAGALVVTPDVGGNMAYCRPEENCLLVGFEDAGDYVAALQRLAAMPSESISKLRDAGYATTTEFDLASERAGFAAFLDELWGRIETWESAATAPPLP